MIDYVKIGKRITEERKYIRKFSQEKMAEDLGMYQADISNLEKAKKGSGITDLAKLDDIAAYFEIPIETLLFGRTDKNMTKYYGDKMKLKEVKGHQKISQLRVIAKLTGLSKEEIRARCFECGPYTIYGLIERQYHINSNSQFDENGKLQKATFTLDKLHLYAFFGIEVIAVMVVDITTIMEHLYQPSLKSLQQMIQGDVLDVTDVYRTLNPYWALWMLTPEENSEKLEFYQTKGIERMNSLRKAGENRPVLYIENCYVREDSRMNGIFRMLVDLLKQQFSGCIIWLNMEPTAGGELEKEYTGMPCYTTSELGQLSLNASIAEKVGLTIDPDVWHREAETINAVGDMDIEVVLVRKCAYYLPLEIREILKDDGDLVAIGRAVQKIIQGDEQSDDNKIRMDFYDEYIDEFHVCQFKETVISGPDIGHTLYFYAAESENNISRLGVTRKNVLDHGLNHEGQLENYNNLEEAKSSVYGEKLSLLNQLLKLNESLTGL